MVHYNGTTINGSTPQTTTAISPKVTKTPDIDELNEFNNLQPVTPQGQTPSYLKLSCSLSGYSSYKSYGSPPNNNHVDPLKTNGVSPKRHILGKSSGKVTPTIENIELDNESPALITPQSLSARGPEREKVESIKKCKSADYQTRNGVCQPEEQQSNSEDSPPKVKTAFVETEDNKSVSDSSVAPDILANGDITLKRETPNHIVLESCDFIDDAKVDDLKIVEDEHVKFEKVPRLDLEEDEVEEKVTSPVKVS